MNTQTRREEKEEEEEEEKEEEKKVEDGRWGRKIEVRQSKVTHTGKKS